jgi:selenophosphate synthetase-related protein
MKPSLSNFDSTSSKSSEDVLLRLEALVEIAENELASAAKDISNPGVLGTIGMLLETSGVGADIDIAGIPRPETVDLRDWMLVYPGCGFVLSCPEEGIGETLRILRDGKLSAEIVGKATGERKMTVTLDGDSRILFDFEKEIITGAVAGPTTGARDD